MKIFKKNKHEQILNIIYLNAIAADNKPTRKLMKSYRCSPAPAKTNVHASILVLGPVCKTPWSEIINIIWALIKMPIESEIMGINLTITTRFNN